MKPIKSLLWHNMSADYKFMGTISWKLLPKIKKHLCSKQAKTNSNIWMNSMILKPNASGRQISSGQNLKSLLRKKPI